MQQISLVDPVAGTQTPQGYRCVPVGKAGSIDSASLPPVVITVTIEDLKRMPIDTPIAHAGPERGWLPVNMVNVLHTDADTQELETDILGTPVRIRATPVEFHWDLGDGNTITTTDPGKPFPSERVSSEYRFEGWYDITLTTTFTGQFSVDGGEWQDIEGSIEIESDSVELYAKSLESRLVNGSTDEDDNKDEDEEEPWIPDRTPDTEGPIDPEARHRRI